MEYARKPSRYSSIVDPIQDPAIGRGIEIEVAQESGRAVKSIVAPVAFLIHHQPRSSGISLRRGLPPAVSEVPGSEDGDDAVGRAPPDKASRLIVVVALCDENHLAISTGHAPFPIGPRQTKKTARVNTMLLARETEMEMTRKSTLWTLLTSQS
jgi:hypothetical protein